MKTQILGWIKPNAVVFPSGAMNFTGLVTVGSPEPCSFLSLYLERSEALEFLANLDRSIWRTNAVGGSSITVPIGPDRSIRFIREQRAELVETLSVALDSFKKSNRDGYLALMSEKRQRQMTAVSYS